MGFLSTLTQALTSKWKRYGHYQEAKDCRGTGTLLRKYDDGALKLYPAPEIRAFLEEFVIPQEGEMFRIGIALNGHEIDTTYCSWDKDDKSLHFRLALTVENLLITHGVLEFGIYGGFLGMFNSRGFN